MGSTIKLDQTTKYKLQSYKLIYMGKLINKLYRIQLQNVERYMLIYKFCLVTAQIAKRAKARLKRAVIFNSLNIVLVSYNSML